jgi:hypothetical protein
MMTTNQLLILTNILFFSFSSGLAQEAEKETSIYKSFAVAKVHFEQNATDEDVEVVFEIKGGDEGLNKLTVVSPDDRIVIDFTAPGNSPMGIRQFHFESPEPKDIDALKTAYPEGVYKYTGVTGSGIKFYSESTLNKELPATVSLINPKPESENVSIENLVIIWTPVEDAASYIIEIDQDELGFNINSIIGGDRTNFSLPIGVLVAGKEYTLGIGTVSENGNISVVETSFTTNSGE